MTTTNAKPQPLDVAALRDQLHDLAKRQGIQRWDLGASRSFNASVQVDRGEAKQMKASQRSSITVRAWNKAGLVGICLLYTSPSPRDKRQSRMPSSA